MLKRKKQRKQLLMVVGAMIIIYFLPVITQVFHQYFVKIREFVTKVMSQTLLTFSFSFFRKKSKSIVYTLIKCIYLDIMYLL